MNNLESTLKRNNFSAKKHWFLIMISESYFNLTRPNFESNAASGFRDLRTDSEFSDVTLSCTDSGRKSIQAHKFILSAHSPVFKEMFVNQNKFTIPYIYLKNVSYENLSSLLDFIYCGVVKVPKLNLTEFLSLAQEFEIQGLNRGLDEASITTKKVSEKTGREINNSFDFSYNDQRKNTRIAKLSAVKTIHEGIDYDTEYQTINDVIISTINDFFDCKTPFSAERKLIITNLKLKIAIKLKNDGFMVIFRRFGAKN